MKRILLNSIVVLAGIIAGGGLGGYLAFERYSRQFAVVRGFSWAEMSFAVSENQFDQNTKDAKKDLLNTLGLFDRGIHSSKLDSAMKNALRMIRGEIEAQLSILESEAGNNNQAKSYLSRAQEDLKVVGWIDYSEETILRTFKRKPLPPCGTSTQNATNKPAAEKPCS